MRAERPISRLMAHTVVALVLLTISEKLIDVYIYGTIGGQYQ